MVSVYRVLDNKSVLTESTKHWKTNEYESSTLVEKIVAHVSISENTFNMHISENYVTISEFPNTPVKEAIVYVINGDSSELKEFAKKVSIKAKKVKVYFNAPAKYSDIADFVSLDYKSDDWM